MEKKNYDEQKLYKDNAILKSLSKEGLFIYFYCIKF